MERSERSADQNRSRSPTLSGCDRPDVLRKGGGKVTGSEYILPDLSGKKRRSKKEMQSLLDATLKAIDDEPGSMTIRHLCYVMESRSYIEKTERAFKTYDGHLVNWRRAGMIPWNAFVDNTRWHYGSTVYDGLEEALIQSRDAYRRNLWADLDAYIEIWTEKDAIAGVLLEAADPYGVKVLPLRGFASLSMLHNAATTFREMGRRGKEVYIYYFGDHDPSGRLIDPSALRSLEDDFGVTVNFERVALTEDQIQYYNLPTRPTKKSNHSKKFKGRSVEIDALPMGTLRDLVDRAITQHIPPGCLDMMHRIEAQEKAGFDVFINYTKGGRL